MKISDADLALITFKTSNNYSPAIIGDPENSKMGSSVFVGGYPLATTAVNQRIFRFLKGDVIANAKSKIENGYQLIYSNPTLPGMSGGPVLNQQGEVIAVHGQGEIDVSLSQVNNVAVKTGNNMAVPITYYNNLITIQKELNHSSIPGEDYYIALSEIAQRKSNFDQLEKYAQNAIDIRPSMRSYRYLIYALLSQKKFKKANDAVEIAFRIPIHNAEQLSQRASIKFLFSMTSYSGIRDLEDALEMDPNNARYMTSLAWKHYFIGYEADAANIIAHLIVDLHFKKIEQQYPEQKRDACSNLSMMLDRSFLKRDANIGRQLTPEDTRMFEKILDTYRTYMSYDICVPEL